MIILGSGTFLLLVFWLVCAAPTARIAYLSNQNVFKWAFFGLIFGPFALLAACFMPNRNGKIRS